MDAAVGLRIHTGWAVAVVVAGSRATPEVVHRARVELVDAALPNQVFHAAADSPPASAEVLIRRVERSAREYADAAIGVLEGAAAAAGHHLAAVALCAEPHSLPTDLARILGNHALIHAAEGELYREALEQAAEWRGLPVVQVGPKRVAATVADELELGPDQQQAMVTDLGRRLGPPWRADHKQAVLLALLALAERSTPTRPGR
jgi:hypothetical protein